MDPAEFKRKNMMHDGDETPIGGHVSHIRGVEALERAIELSGYNRPRPKNVGRGLAFSEWSPSGGEGNVFVKIEEDGKVKVSSPVVDQGAGVLTVIVECVGQELGVPAARSSSHSSTARPCRAMAVSAAAAPRGSTATHPIEAGREGARRNNRRRGGEVNGSGSKSSSLPMPM